MDILIEEFEQNIWAIALDHGRLEGIEVDATNETVRYGSIYWAKVVKIDAALDAAFLDLDGDNTGILYNRDTRIPDKNGVIKSGGDTSIGLTLSPGDMIPVQAKTAYLYDDRADYLGKEDKTAKMSMDITLPGRFLIYCAMMQTNRISSRIRGEKLRTQLNDMIESLDDMKGFILRSSAADMQTEILRREASILRDMWLQISAYFTGNEPALIALGPDSVQRTLSDKATTPIERIEVVTMDHFTQVEEWCAIFAPDLITKITPVELKDGDRDLALLHHRDVTGQIEALLQNYVLLPHGGNLIIQQTAALTAIDINKGSDKRSHLATNIEAAIEIARQIRLRNLGGIIIIDFIKMGRKDQARLIKEMDNQTYTDPCTVQIHGFTKLGLMEMTRNRRTPPLNERLIDIDF